ncbi:MAG: glycoside hydrolase [Candidatus Solibacter usitatus]|nr:glycoside hydrolase [Candidatus Solibacter usitatus]
MPRRILFATAPFLVLAGAFAPSDSIRDLEKAFRTPPDDTRIMMRWWWFGPAVEPVELEREMKLMKEGGIGGFEVQPVYPLVLDDEIPGVRSKKYLSPEFLDALKFTSAKSRELGLRMDLTLGSGWPYGGPNTPITEAAPRLKMQRTAVAAGAREVAAPKEAEGEKFLAAFLLSGAEPASAVELPAPKEGRIALPATREGSQSVLFFMEGRTRQAVKRAGVGGEGWVHDHYNRAALDNHLRNVAEPLLRTLAGTPPYALFCDSLEVFGSDWTGDLLDEFRRRRGYDLKPFLPALAINLGHKTGAIRNDWAMTLSELAEERFLKPLQQWAHQHGTKLRAQTYGTPPVTFSSQAYVDLPEGEEPHWKQFTPTRWASSANHLFGRPVTSSETWTWLHSPSFRATPLDMKVEADRHFLIGVNQLIGHGWPYSPPEAGEPGWRFYASGVFNHHNPWWMVMPEVTSYLQRVSFLMREGKPANDVALYIPTADIRAGFTLGRATIDRGINAQIGATLIPRILESGYQYDLFDDGTSERAARYPILVLPGVERIPLATYRRLESYVRQGGILVATKRAPSLAPGLRNAEAETAAIQEISRKLFEGASPPAHLLKEEAGLRDTLRRLRTPDVEFPQSAANIGFLHRSTPAAEIYFVANTGNQTHVIEPAFRIAGMQPEWWNPFTGEVSGMKIVGKSDRTTTVRMTLAPYESRIIAFTRRSIGVGNTTGPPPPQPVLLNTGWKVTFANGHMTTADVPRSWTEDPATRFYSGTAAYERTAVIPPALARAAKVELQFGEGTPLSGTQPESKPGMKAWIESPVREAATVYVNNKRAGVVWQPPYSVDVTRTIKAGENNIRIIVANTAINLLAKGPQPDYTALKAKYGDRFQPQDMNNLQPVPSGILSAVRIAAAERRE